MSLVKLDIKCFRCGGTRVVLDEGEELKRQQVKQEIFRQHKQWRDEVEKRRDMDRQHRNIAKERQIQMAEEWQAALDKVREDINTAREAYRQTFIVQVRNKQLFFTAGVSCSYEIFQQFNIEHFLQNLV